MEKILSTMEAMELLQVSRPTLYLAIHSKQIPALRIGRSWRFSREALLRSLRNGEGVVDGNGTEQSAEQAA